MNTNEQTPPSTNPSTDELSSPPSRMDFHNPYANLPKGAFTRTTINVSNAAMAKIKAVYPKVGVLQTLTSLLLEKFIKELEQQGITEYDPDRFQLAISDASICLGGCQYAIVSADYTHTNYDTGEHINKGESGSTATATTNPTSPGRSASSGNRSRKRRSSPTKSNS